jgi:hypothetical protein
MKHEPAVRQPGSQTRECNAHAPCPGAFLHCPFGQSAFRTYMAPEPNHSGVILPEHQTLWAREENRAMPFQDMPDKACEKR